MKKLILILFSLIILSGCTSTAREYVVVERVTLDDNGNYWVEFFDNDLFGKTVLLTTTKYQVGDTLTVCK